MLPLREPGNRAIHRLRLSLTAYDTVNLIYFGCGLAHRAQDPA